MKSFLILFFMMPFITLASYQYPDEAFELNQEDLSPSSQDLLKKKEKFSRDESEIRPYNYATGVRDSTYYTGQDYNRLALALNINGHYEFPQRLLSFDGSWMRKAGNWNKLWYGIVYRQTIGQWSQITQNKNSGAEANFQRSDDSTQNISTLGVGVGYRFKLLLDFIETENVFETIHIFGNVNRLYDSFTEDTYQGYGLSAEYSIHKRTRSHFFYGFKFGHHISWLEIPGESERQLSLGWYTLGLETGFIF